MRVLVVSDVTGYMPGGVPEVTRHLLEGLVARGHKVTFAGDIPLGGNGVEHAPIALPTGRAFRGQVLAALDWSRPDIVHVMALGAAALFDVASDLRPYPCLITCHSIPPYECKISVFHANEWLHYGSRALRFLPNSLAWRWLFCSRKMSHIVVHSAVNRDIVVRYGANPAKVSLIPLGFQPRLGSAAGVDAWNGSAPKMVTVGGLAHTKGQHDMVAAMPEIGAAFPGASYTMIGELRDASYGAFLKRTIEQLGLTETVTWVEGLSNAEKERHLQRAQLYVQPSHEEGFCLAFIEAAGVVPRLVGADTGTIAAVCEGDAMARLVPVRSPHRLAAAAIDLLRARSSPGAMAQRARRLAERFAWSGYLDAHEALYDALIATHGGRTVAAGP